MSRPASANVLIRDFQVICTLHWCISLQDVAIQRCFRELKRCRYKTTPEFKKCWSPQVQIHCERSCRFPDSGDKVRYGVARNAIVYCIGLDDMLGYKKHVNTSTFLLWWVHSKNHDFVNLDQILIWDYFSDSEIILVLKEWGCVLPDCRHSTVKNGVCSLAWDFYVVACNPVFTLESL